MFDIVWITVWRNFIFKNNMLIIKIDFVIVINVIKISFRSIGLRIWFFYASLQFFGYHKHVGIFQNFKIFYVFSAHGMNYDQVISQSITSFEENIFAKFTFPT